MEKRSHRKGKTYEELYGKEKAEIIKESLSKSHMGLKYPTHKTGKDIKCEHCGKKFYVAKWQLKRGVKYCSKECSSLNRHKFSLTKKSEQNRIKGLKRYYKNHDSHRKGLKLSKKEKEKIRLTTPRKENHYNWKGGITPEVMLIRNSVEYKSWRKNVYQRDNYTCQICGKQKCYLHAHHIKSFADHPKLRFDINNGITLCKKCHYELHKKSSHCFNKEFYLVMET